MVPIPKTKNSLSMLLIVAVFIFADLICENFIVMINDQQSHLVSTTFLFCFLVLQIFFSPIQAGFSDFGRKKALIISLSLSLVSLICIYFFLEMTLPLLAVLFIAISLKGIWGNTVALAWAAIADTQDKNYRASYALGTGVYAIAYLILISLRNFAFNDLILLACTVFILLIALFSSIFLFKDSEDETVEKNPEVEKIRRSPRGISKYFTIFWLTLKEQKVKIIRDLKEKQTRKALFAYLFWEISMYSILISQIDLRQSSDVNNHIATLMMIGYLTGVVILRLKRVHRVSDSLVLKWGYYISFFSLIPYFILLPFISFIKIVVGICYYFHAFGNAFLSSALLTVVSKERAHHEQGKILGLVESSDTVAFMLALAFVMMYNRLQLPLVYLVSFSFVSFSISWVYYGRFKGKERSI